MTKKKQTTDEDAEQSRRFLEAAAELEAAGELNPTDDALEKVMRGVVRLREEWFGPEEEENPPSERDPPGD
jgi:hypothetical protein